jgi:hypothetical protein
MSRALNISKLTTGSIKQYLVAKGYNVAIKADTRATKNYQRAFSIKFADNQPVAQSTLSTIAEKFSPLFPYNSTFRLFLSDEAIIEILPLLPDLKKGHVRDLVNTFSHTSTAQIPIRRTRAQAIKDNQLALDLLTNPGFEAKSLTLEERRILESYAGVGSQYTDDQQNNIDALTQFYTPDFVGERLYRIATEMGFPTDGKVLEPSCGVGRLIKHAPIKENVTAFEISDIPYRITKKLYPQAEIHNLYFEQAFLKAPRYNDLVRPGITWLKGYPFDLIIGNPPYGKHKNIYQSFFGNPKFPQIEFFFMYYGAKLLKPGGLLMYVTSSNFLNTGLSYQLNKEKILELLKFERAYRMPNNFMELTEVGTDILIFRKK